MASVKCVNLNFKIKVHSHGPVTASQPAAIAHFKINTFENFYFEYVVLRTEVKNTVNAESFVLSHFPNHFIHTN